MIISLDTAIRRSDQAVVADAAELLRARTGRSALLAVLVLALSACSMTPVYRQPVAPVPQTLGEAVAMPAADSTADFALQGWKQVFVDPQLQQLIETGLAQNRSLRETILNVDAARAQYRIRRADFLPNVGMYGEGGRQRVPGDLSPTGTTTTGGQYAAGALASYEVDFFGRVRSLNAEALERYLATEEARRTAHISLVSEIAGA